MKIANDEFRIANCGMWSTAAPAVVFDAPVEHLAEGHHVFLPSLAGLLHLMNALPSHEWLGYCHRVAPRRPNASRPRPLKNGGRAMGCPIVLSVSRLACAPSPGYCAPDCSGGKGLNGAPALVAVRRTQVHISDMVALHGPYCVEPPTPRTRTPYTVPAMRPVMLISLVFDQMNGL